MAAELDAVDLELTPEQEEALLKDVEEQLSAALGTHSQRERKLATYKRAYKSKPEHEHKNFPWAGASNVVIPIVAITVDTVVARLMKSFLGTSTPVEAKILDPNYESLEKDFRDWGQAFFAKSGARDHLRNMFHDMAVDGTAYVKVLWDSKVRPVHAYDASGGVTRIDVIDYEGPVWQAIPASDLIYPEGFDEWSRLPWIAERLRFTWRELKEAEAKGMYADIDDTLKSTMRARDDQRHKAQQEGSGVVGDSGTLLIEMYEIWGIFEVPSSEPDGEPEFLDVILTYCPLDRRFHRKIHNPFFGHARHIVRVPFLVQPHEVDGLGLAEQAYQFQIEASTAHNQTIDSATAAIAGIIVKKPSANLQGGEEIYPGKIVTTDEPLKDLTVVHLSQGNSSLPNVEQQAAFWNEKRTGVSAYNMGVESPIAGSRATATGTTALISEGNIRFWVSIDDMKNAIVDLLYLTLQLEQQMRPEGTPISESRTLQLPQGDLRSVFGMTLAISSEKVNRDIEMQNLQILTNILNDYYARLMQACAMALNPMVPPAQTMVAVQVMEASASLVKRIIERFDMIENVDQLIPHISQAIQMMQGVIGANPQMAGPVPGAAGPVPAGVQGGPRRLSQGGGAR